MLSCPGVQAVLVSLTNRADSTSNSPCPGPAAYFQEANDIENSGKSASGDNLHNWHGCFASVVLDIRRLTDALSCHKTDHHDLAH